jgi:hypothetical protein
MYANVRKNTFIDLKGKLTRPVVTDSVREMNSALLGDCIHEPSNLFL